MGMGWHLQFRTEMHLERLIWSSNTHKLRISTVKIQYWNGLDLSLIDNQTPRNLSQFESCLDQFQIIGGTQHSGESFLELFQNICVGDCMATKYQFVDVLQFT